MTDKPTIAPEEAELLSQEEELRAKQESGENLKDEEKDSLSKIEELQQDLAERFKGEKDTPEETERKKQIASLQAQKEHFRNKFGKESERAKELEIKLSELKSKAQYDSRSGDDREWREEMEFKVDHPEFTSDEREFIAIIAKGKGISLSEATKMDEVSNYIKLSREKTERENKIPSPTSRSGQISPQAKEIEEAEDEESHKQAYYRNRDDLIRKGRANK